MHWQPCRRHVDWSQRSSACRMRQESPPYALIFCWLGPCWWGDWSSCSSSCGCYIYHIRDAQHTKQMRRNCSQWTIIAFAFYLLPRREDANLEYTASQSQSLLQNAVTIIIIIVIILLHGNCCCVEYCAVVAAKAHKITIRFTICTDTSREFFLLCIFVYMISLCCNLPLISH